MSYFMITSDQIELCLNCGQWTDQEGVWVSFDDRPQGIRCDECQGFYNKERAIH